MELASLDLIAIAPASVEQQPCPLNHGLAVLDQLLAALTAEDQPTAFDVALDLRSLLQREADAEAVLRDTFRLRALVEDRHYLACYRLRRWLEAHVIARVSLSRTQPEQLVAVRLDAPDLLALCAECAGSANAGASVPLGARVSFEFKT